MTNSAKRWMPLAALVAVSLAGAFAPETSASSRPGGPISSADVAWMLSASGLVLLMTPGLAFFYGGMVDKKNIIGCMLKSFVALGVISVLWIVVGFSLAFGESIGGFVGNPLTYGMFQGVGLATHPELSPTIPLALFALFQLKFAIIAPALISGALTERIRFSSYLLFITAWSLCVYCPLAHMVWHPQGFLHELGVHDFAGGIVVHISAGYAALAGAILLGKRAAQVSGEAHVPSNIPLVLLGTGMLWFGWFGFNAGSALAANEQATQAFLTTNTASASALLAWLFLDLGRGKKPTAIGACIGAVVGLVAITPAAGYVSVGASIFIGAAGSMVSNVVCGLWHKTGIDDVLEVFPCHGVGGMVGMALTAVFAEEGSLITGDVRAFFVEIAAMAVISVVTFAAGWVLFKLTALVIPLRVSEDEERIGLDISQHGESLWSLQPSLPARRRSEAAERQASATAAE